MDVSDISPDEVVLWKWAFLRLNATILWTWVVMAVMAFGSWLVTRNLSTGATISRWQNLFEVIVGYARDQIRQIMRQPASQYLPVIGTLFLFIAVSNALTIVPGYVPPTASLSTTAALATCVFVAVPVYGVINQGLAGFLKHYLEPTVLMLPFHVVGELSRTLALAVRLFGNVMSGTKIAAILLAVAPLLFPILIQALGLLTGLIQAYIFAVLAAVYIASGEEAAGQGQPSNNRASDQEVSSAHP
jgi:F-type H+-transporting ATPase subunit a